MACKGICKKYSIDGIAVRDWDKDKDLMRCSTCDIIIHRENWVVTQLGRKTCPCCKLQLKGNSRGKIARQNRRKAFLDKIEA